MSNINKEMEVRKMTISAFISIDEEMKTKKY
jgi:hypothetical protein